MIIYVNLLLALQAEAVGAAVYVLNLIPSNALDRDYLRYIIDSILGRSINTDKLLLNILRVYSATTIVYDYSIPRGEKFTGRGQRRQLVGYEDSIYRIQVLLEYKVIRLLYYQFVETGKLLEIPSTAANIVEEFDQQFEKNVIDSKGKALDIPIGYIVEIVEEDSTSDGEDNFTSVTVDYTTERDVLQAVDKATELLNSLPKVGYNYEEPKVGYNYDEAPLQGYEEIRPGLLELPIDETLLRASRRRTKTAKA